jgi:small subunit ribosomal protein S16
MGGCLPRDYGCAAVTHVRQNRIRATRWDRRIAAWQPQENRFIMAVKIKLTRLGKIRNPQYRIAVADARTRRDGRSIEVIGRYHPKEDPSLIEIDSERAQYWLSVGAQPTEPVLQLLKITGDWQKFKGLPGAEGTLKVKEPKPSKLDLFNAALAEADGAPTGEATTAKKKKAPAKKAAAEKAEAEAPAETAEAAAPAEAAEAPAEAAAPAETAEAPAESAESTES